MITPAVSRRMAADVQPMPPNDRARVMSLLKSMPAYVPDWQALPVPLRTLLERYEPAPVTVVIPPLSR